VAGAINMLQLLQVVKVVTVDAIQVNFCENNGAVVEDKAETEKTVLDESNTKEDRTEPPPAAMLPNKNGFCDKPNSDMLIPNSATSPTQTENGKRGERFV